MLHKMEEPVEVSWVPGRDEEEVLPAVIREVWGEFLQGTLRFRLQGSLPKGGVESYLIPPPPPEPDGGGFFVYEIPIPKAHVLFRYGSHMYFCQVVIATADEFVLTPYNAMNVAALQKVFPTGCLPRMP